jgi:hypothetical protein
MNAGQDQYHLGIMNLTGTEPDFSVPQSYTIQVPVQIGNNSGGINTGGMGNNTGGTTIELPTVILLDMMTCIPGEIQNLNSMVSNLRETRTVKTLIQCEDALMNFASAHLMEYGRRF